MADYCRHLTKCADAACSYRQVASEAQAEVRERIAADIEAHIYANPLTTQERWQASGLRAAARIARGVRHDPSATTDGGAP